LALGGSAHRVYWRPLQEDIAMDMDRRKFLTVTMAGAGALLAGCQGSSKPAASAAPAKHGPFDIVPLGKTGLEVSRIGMGTGMRGGGRQSNQTRLGSDVFEKLLRDAYDRGVRLFDCADMYGTHPYVGRALNSLPRQRYVIVSKIWRYPGNALPEPERPDADVVVDRFRKELNTDYIDLVLLHCMTTANWTEQQKKQMDILDDLKAKGKIRAHGVSVHSLAALKAAAASPWVDSIHARINAYGEKMDGPPALVAPVLQEAHAAGKGVVGMKLIGEGAFRTDDERRNQSVQYVLGLGCVDTMVVGFEKLAEIDDFSARVAQALEHPVAVTV
jgi:aryl-alcohol dehydrogenase-like predicted oxidoreductase